MTKNKKDMQLSVGLADLALKAQGEKL